MNEAEPVSRTRGVETLLGEPKRAVVRLALPMIAAMSVQTLYNLADAVWVSGLGRDALSAVGFFFPFFFLAMALSNGIGVGAGTAISRAIGGKRKDRADRVATHALVIMAGAAVLFTAPMLIFIRPVLRSMGAEEALGSSVAYARVMFGGSALFFFANVANNLLRAEGDARRAMLAMVAGSALNIVLDPIFIYAFGLGVSGAAWASLASMFATALVVGNWLFRKRDTWVSFRWRGFKFRREICAEISRVGLPAAVMHGSMFLMSFFLTVIVARVGGESGVAIYTTGWRVLSVAILPMLGVASAATAVCGAAFGARDIGKLRTSYLYSVRIGVVLESAIALATFTLAPLIARAFTWAPGSAPLRPGLTTFLRIIWLFYPAVAFGMISSSLFQGIGRGSTALAMTVIRTLVFTVPAAWAAGVLLGGGLAGVWWGIVAAHLAYAPVAFGWSMQEIRRQDHSFTQRTNCSGTNVRRSHE